MPLFLFISVLLISFPVQAQFVDMDEWYKKLQDLTYSESIAPTEEKPKHLQVEKIEQKEEIASWDEEPEWIAIYEEIRKEEESKVVPVKSIEKGTKLTQTTQEKFSEVLGRGQRGDLTWDDLRILVKVAQIDQYPKAIELLAYMHYRGIVIPQDIEKAWLLYDVLYRMETPNSNMMRSYVWSKLNSNQQAAMAQYYDSIKLEPKDLKLNFKNLLTKTK